MNRPLIRLAEGYSKQKNANLLPKKLSTQMFCLLWRRNKGARWRKVLDFFDFGTFSRKYKKKTFGPSPRTKPRFQTFSKRLKLARNGN
jgi:hypothetical protein